MSSHSSHPFRFAPLLAVFTALCVTASAAPAPGEALQQLQQGNVRFTSTPATHPTRTAEHRTETARGQAPFATVLTCSDSRLPVELIFDQGLGDLFVVRVAGNVAKTDEIGSIEYGTGHLGTRLLVVLGHSSCGAVKAVLEGAEVHGSIPALVEPIGPAVAAAKAAQPGLSGAPLLARAVETNVWLSIERILEQSATVRELVGNGQLQVVGAVYDLAAGSVQWMGSHPEQARLLAASASSGPAADPHAATPADDTHAAAADGSHATPDAGPHSAGATATHATSLSPLTLVLGGIGLLLLLAGAWRFSRTGMQHWPVNTRLAAGFGSLLVVLAALALESYFSLHATLGGFNEYRADATHSNLAGEMHTHYLEMRIAAKDLALFRTREAIERYETHRSALLGLAREARTRMSEPAVLKKLAVIEEEVGGHARLHQELQATVRTGDTARIAAVNQRMGALGTTIDRELTAIEQEFLSQQQLDSPRIEAEILHTQSAVVWLGLAAILVGLGLALIITRSITGPLREMAESLGAGAEQTTAAASQVSAASQSLAEGASEQAASLEETSASLEEISSMTKRNAESAQQAKSLSSQTNTAAGQGSHHVTEMHAAMDGIKASSDEIAKIVKTIDEIAFQTNILALNAAVEAARAGEHGAGFAVVAEEVRALAQRSATAARETADKIEAAIQKSTHGVRISASVAQSLAEIADKTRQVDTLVAEIAQASQEQSSGVHQVNQAVSQMDKVTQANAGNAEETAAAAEELNAQAFTLTEAVNQLRQLVGGAGRAVKSRPAALSAAPKAPAPLRAAQTKTGAAPRPTPATVRRPEALAVTSRGRDKLDDFFQNS